MARSLTPPFLLGAYKRYNLRFADEADEEAYRNLVITDGTQLVRLAALLAALLVLIFGFFEVQYGQSIGLRIYWLVVIVLFLLVTYSPWYANTSQLTGSLAVIVFCAGWWLYGLADPFFEYTTQIQVLVFCFFFCGLFLLYAASVGIVVLALYLYMAVNPASPPSAMQIYLALNLVSIYILLALAAYQKERLSRRLFLREKNEKELILREHTNNERYLNWLKTLATFLRHEVRQPIAQIHSSLDVLDLLAGENKEIGAQLRVAASSTEQVWILLERASRATDAEAFVRQSRQELISLVHLTTVLVGQYGRTTTGNSLRTIVPSEDVIVRADPALVEAAINNLLANASSFSREGSTIDVEVLATDQTGEVAVRNTGQTLDADPEELFGAFVSTRSGMDNDHHGIGLYLVRLIAEHHGGGASLRDLNDASGVEAKIWFPRQLKPAAPQSNDNLGPAPT